MANHARRILLILLAFLLIVAGVLGLVLPLLPGIVLLILGLLILSMFSPQVDAWVRSLSSRHPAAHSAAEGLRAFLERILGSDKK